MGSLKALTLAGVVAMGAISAVRAADLPPPPPPEPIPVAGPAEFSGWYLRGDVGLGIYNKDPKFSMAPNPLSANPNYCDGGGNCYSGASYDSYKFHNGRLSTATFVSLGVGYQLNNWLRFDVTGEWRGGTHLTAVDQLIERGTYTHYTNGVADFGPAGYTRTLRNFYRGNVTSFVAMFNGYVDLGTYWGVTPYVGAGVGLARNKITGLTDQGFSYNTISNIGSPTGGYWSDGEKTNFAWALMAGLGYNVTQNLKLELGYRYMNLGSIKSGQSRCFNGTGANGGFDACNFTLSSQRLDSHDIRLGMRWMLGDATPAPVPVVYQQPLVRKY